MQDLLLTVFTSSFLMLAILAAYCWRYRHTPLGWPFIAITLIGCFWSLLALLDLFALPLAGHVWIARLRFMGFSTLPLASFVLTVRHTQRFWIGYRELAALLAIPCITVVLAFTSDFHTLLRYNFTEVAGPVPTLAYTNGPWFWVHLAYSYGLSTVSMILLLASISSAQSFFKRQSLFLLAGLGLPFAFDVPFVFGSSPLPGYNLAPSMFAPAAAMIAWALFRYKVLDLTPISRSVLLDKMSELMLVLDPQDRILDLNAPARRVLNIDSSAVGRPISAVVPELAAQLKESDSDAALWSVRLPGAPDARAWEISASPIPLRHGSPARLFRLHDATERERGAEAYRQLENSQAQYRALLENAPLPVVIVSLEDDRILYANSRCCLQFQIPIAVALGSTSILFFVHDYDRRKLVAAVLRHGRVTDLELELKNRSGAHFWAYVSANRTEFDGRPAILAFFNDITERKRIEQALRESEERHRLLADNASDVIWTMNAEGRFTYVSPSVEKLRGYTVEEVMQQSISEALTPASAAIALEGLATALQRVARGEPFEGQKFELEQPCKDGSTVWTEVTTCGMYNSAGQFFGILGVTRDSTADKRARDEIRRLKEFNENIVQNMAEGIVVQDRNGLFSFVNPATESLLGYNSGELIGRHWHTIIPPDHRSIVETADLRRCEGHADHYEVDLRRRDGERLHVLVAGSPRRDPLTGAPDGTLAVFTDITARRQAELELYKAKEAAEAANRAKSLFLANMSHEIRTPLNAILGFAQVLGRDATLSPTQRENVATIQHSGEHLLSLINSILDMSKIEAGRMTLHNRVFSLRQLLAEVERLFRARANEKGLRLSFDPASDLPPSVYGDEGKLRQVLINLVGNACKFTSQGAVQVRVQRSPSSPDTHIWMEVLDSGPGIALEEMRDLFTPFTQTRTGRQAAEGTGLGLALSREFVRLMGGELGVTSAPGTGSRFYFELELATGLATEHLDSIGSERVSRWTESRTLEPLTSLPAALTLESCADRLKACPTEWRSALHEAIELGDFTRVEAEIEQIRSCDPALADQLRTWARDLNQQTLLQITTLAASTVA